MTVGLQLSARRLTLRATMRSVTDRQTDRQTDGRTTVSCQEPIVVRAAVRSAITGHVLTITIAGLLFRPPCIASHWETCR